MNINLSTYAVRDGASGAVDMSATVAKFQADLETFVAARETEESTIANALSAVFAKLNGASANVPYLVSQTLQQLNISAMPNQFKTLEKRVHAYITEQSKGDNSMIVVGKGRNASTQLRSVLEAQAAK